MAELAVRVGANVAEGQYVAVNCLVEHAPLARRIAEAAYDAGARYVEVSYGDQHVRRAMIQKASDEVLEWAPDWAVRRLDELGASNGATIAITGDPEPQILGDLDQARVGRARPPKLAEAALRNVMRRQVNWTIVSYPNEGWAQTVF